MEILRKLEILADGGTFTTKPYLCGSNNVLKMSPLQQDEHRGTADGLITGLMVG